MLNRFLVLILTVHSANALADSFRCGRKVVKTGDTVNTLIKKCGSPTRKFSGKEVVSDGGQRSKVAVSNWIFDRRRKSDIVVSVRSGKVVKIRVE